MSVPSEDTLPPLGERYGETSALLSRLESSSSYGIAAQSFESTAAVAASVGEGTSRTRENSNVEESDGDEIRDGAIGMLTRRLRCLFSTITWPIVPLGTIVALALLWVMYAAISQDLRNSCSHPLHWYASASLVLVSYIPHHARFRSHLFQYSRERDGPIRPIRVRMYDQFFHTICLLYVYSGVTLIQTCEEDLVGNEKVDESDEMTLDASLPMNSCEATCPNLYQALSVYVATLELFTFALILPLLFLPCIYLWFLRRATSEAEAFATLQDRLREDEAFLRLGGITVGEIIESLESVKLVSRTNSHSSGTTEKELWLRSCSATSASPGTISDVKECCICMTDFPIELETDLEEGILDEETSMSQQLLNSPSYPYFDQGIVRTECGHIFHKQCLSGWLGGRWQINPNATNDSTGDEDRPEEIMRRRAKQVCCPLCRKDLRPSS